jgi:hypothetical protein
MCTELVSIAPSRALTMMLFSLVLAGLSHRPRGGHVRREETSRGVDEGNVVDHPHGEFLP